MMDGSSCSPATVCETNQCHCNSHARRKLEEKADLYPEHWEVVKKVYRDIYAVDAEIKHTMSPEERLDAIRTRRQELNSNRRKTKVANKVDPPIASSA